MKGRDSRFPERGDLIARAGRGGWPLSKRGRLLLWSLVMFVVLVWTVWERVGTRMSGPPVPAMPAPGLLSTPNSAAHDSAPLVLPKAAFAPTASVDTEPLEVPVPIGMGFRPVGFEIAARQHAIELSDTPGPLLHRLPRFEGASQQYGLLMLNRGQAFSLALDHRPDGPVLFVDGNRNGDLRDDGGPLSNQGDGYFASRLELPLAQTTGVKPLQGDYAVWLFMSEAGRDKGRLNHYALTQLRGRMLLHGVAFDVWLADNRLPDADYRNDGVYIDLDRDGRIQPGREYLPPGKTLSLDGRRYRFSVER